MRLLKFGLLQPPLFVNNLKYKVKLAAIAQAMPSSGRMPRAMLSRMTAAVRWTTSKFRCQEPGVSVPKLNIVGRSGLGSWSNELAVRYWLLDVHSSSRLYESRCSQARPFL